MKKKITFMAVLLIALLTLTGCGEVTTKKSNQDAIAFKKDYESLNGKTGRGDTEYRNVSINKENPFEYTTADEIVKRIDKKETFYVYFGDSKCPWCRSVIEKAIEVANKNNIDTIYYVQIWDEHYNELLRDTYSVDNKGNLTKKSDGSESYKKLLSSFENVLEDYTLTYTNKKGDTKKAKVGEKRIYAPSYIYVEKGVAKKLTTAKSDKLTSPTADLTNEILRDQENMLNEFFKN